MKYSKLKNQIGFAMIEVIIAVSIIVLSVLAAMSVTQKSITLARQSLHTAEASFLLEEGAEIVRFLRDNDWANISSLTNGTNYYPVYSGGWTLSPTVSTIGSFTRTVVVAEVLRDNTTGDIVSSGGTADTGTKLVTITVSWIENGQTLSKSLSFYLMDIFS